MQANEQLINKLARLIKLSEQYIFERAENLCLTKVQAKYLSALMYLENASLSELSRHLDLDKANTTRVVCKLLRLGFITKKRAGDNRAYAVSLTESGRQKAELILSEVNDYFLHLMHGIDQSRLNVFFDTLEDISANAAKLLIKAE